MFVPYATATRHHTGHQAASVVCLEYLAKRPCRGLAVRANSHHDDGNLICCYDKQIIDDDNRVVVEAVVSLDPLSKMLNWHGGMPRFAIVVAKILDKKFIMKFMSS